MYIVDIMWIFSSTITIVTHNIYNYIHVYNFIVGTFITTDISLRRLDHIQTVNIRDTVRRIRSQRAFSIQMPDQYVFCHFALIEHGMREGVVGDVDWTGFDDSDSDMSD